ncbi:MAG: tRNA lysidine(34) synthetase TilS, partial [Synergistaceae bacterium]|nr:tRNA lysidine(34) synthetase TilS [Synergistaceae bacterium]
MAKRFVQTGTRQGWLPTRGDAPVVLGVSGGGDSMAMLWLFRTLYEGPILVAHVEHGIRGREGEEDAAFVQRTCATWGLPCEVRRVDVPGERER